MRKVCEVKMRTVLGRLVQCRAGREAPVAGAAAAQATGQARLRRGPPAKK
jgi:hypothetical protein